MHTATKIALFAAALLILVGICLGIASLAISGGDFSFYQREDDYEVKTREFDADAVTSLVIDEPSHDVRILRSDDETFRITYYESEKSTCRFDQSADGRLRISRHNERRWHFFFWGFNLNDHSTVIELPASFTGNISIKQTSGDLRISGITLSGDITATLTSGNAILSDVTAARLDLTQTSGDLKLGGGSFESVSIQHTSGDIEITGMEANTLRLSSVSGDIDAESIRAAADIYVKTTSGKIMLSDVTTDGTLSCHSTSGNTILKQTACGDAEFSAVSGDIRAEIIGTEEEYFISTSTTSGSVRVPPTHGREKRITARTTSGDIRITLIP